MLVVAAVGLVSTAVAQSPTKTEKTTVWLPPQSTGARESIYASVITAAPSSTEYLLACTTNFRSASSCSHFNGVTLTYGNQTMKVAFRTNTFDCKRGSAATCSVRSANNAAAESVISGSESASWLTAITIIDGHNKLNAAKATTSSTSTTPASAATSASVCKRASRPKGGSGDGGDGCSQATGGFANLPMLMAGLATAVAVGVAAFL
ncbi:hypothetical protein CkaCkLH20_05339 [Colletotrichum karsti]|uniref:GPI-anchored protein n=1 Tax=Colletotrichum karsti TaxID=1095194 RepID=A0A9P6I4A1_9PEZI|nr:uncharacterized protein CkaCkLH20_05339 [Colletotrichum karsti]KAF9877073.1 hypothetical protein CkaCkLH20_05339 [Colletotrichum karsti]